MARDDVGTYPHDCGNSAFIRKDKNSRLYLFCNHCGQDKRNLSGGQDLILAKGTFYGPASPPPPMPVPAAAPEPMPVATKAQAQKPQPTPPPPGEKKTGGWHPLI